MRSFKDFIDTKEQVIKENNQKSDWKKEYIKLKKGFVPPSNLKPIIQAFLDSGSISLTNDVSSKVTMPKKTLFLVGGPVRDFLLGKTPKDLDLATNATPEQIALILHSAGFRVPSKTDSHGNKVPDYDRSGKGKEMDISFKPLLAQDGDKKVWYLKGRDASQEGRPFVIGAVVNGEEFDIATFRKDAKTVNGQSEVDFVDNPIDDAARRDLTINALYIELSKSDGENTKLFDPTKKGWHDINSGNIRTVGKAEDRFNEDKLRVMRAIRFYCQFGKDKNMDEEIKEAIPKFKDLEGVAFERIRDEFLKGLLHPEIDPRKYLKIYNSTGLLKKVFPGVDVRLDVPQQLRDKKDKFLSLSWMLQDNPTEKIEQVLSGSGWSNQEKSIVIYLLKLKEFDKNELEEFLQKRKILGISPEQIKRWVDLFDDKPTWSKMIKTFADFQPDSNKLVTWHTKDPEGKTTGEIHPEIVSKQLHTVPPHFRSNIVKDLNRNKLKQMFDDFSSRI